VVERRLELRIGMSPLYNDAQVSRDAGKKIGIREIELSEVGTIDFENTELEVTFAAPGDENVDCAFYAVIRQQRWCGESGFVLEVVGNHNLPGMERVAGWRFHIYPKRNIANRSWLPAYARADQQAPFAGHVFERTATNFSACPGRSR
jgi:hypothetical protein